MHEGYVVVCRISGSAVESCEEEIVQTAIAADVIEGAPDHRAVLAGVSLDGGGEAPKAVLPHLGRAGGAGRENDPFGLPRRDAILGPRPKRRAPGDGESDTRGKRPVH